MTLESVIAKTMWMLGNFDLHSIDVEDIFYRSINYDVIFGKKQKMLKQIVNKSEISS